MPNQPKSLFLGARPSWMTQLDAWIKILNLDWEEEYTGNDFIKYLKSWGTMQKLNVHNASQQARVAEWWSWTIAEQIHALLHASGLSKSLWEQVACYVVWLLNQMPMKAIKRKTPFEAAFGKKPDMSGIQEWGDKVWVCVKAGNKLGGRIREGCWMGIDEKLKSVWVYWPDKRNVTVKRNVYFDQMLMCWQSSEVLAMEVDVYMCIYIQDNSTTLLSLIYNVPI